MTGEDGSGLVGLTRLPTHPIAGHMAALARGEYRLFDSARLAAEEKVVGFLRRHRYASDEDVAAFVGRLGIDPAETASLLETAGWMVGRGEVAELAEADAEAALVAEPDLATADTVAGRVYDDAMDLARIVNEFAAGSDQEYDYIEDLYIDFANTVLAAVADMSTVVSALRIDYHTLRSGEGAWTGRRRLRWPAGAAFSSDLARCSPDLVELLYAVGALRGWMATASPSERKDLTGRVTWLLFRVLARAGFHYDELGYPATISFLEGEPFYCCIRDLIDIYG